MKAYPEITHALGVMLDRMDETLRASDILALAQNGPFAAEDLRRRATEALGNYIGDLATVRTSIEIICRKIGGK